MAPQKLQELIFGFAPIELFLFHLIVMTGWATSIQQVVNI
jgi:hypothetical protein